MRVKILGAHQGESRDMRFLSIVIDGRLVIDAGGLTSSLTLEEQLGIQAVLITHQHFDHIKDLPMLAHNILETKSLHVYCTYDTRNMLQHHIFNDLIWPSLRTKSAGYNSLVFNAVEPDREFTLHGYKIVPVPMAHTVPTVGYCVKRDGKSLFYTADTRGNGNPFWASLRPDLLIIETTMSNEHDSAAARFGHMTPMALGRELRAFHQKEGYYPRTICVHINAKHERLVREELQTLADELQADITAAHEGMEIEL